MAKIIMEENNKNTTVPSWQGKVQNKEKLTQDDAKFLFDQAEKFLKDTVETSNIIVSRTNTLITIIAGSLVAFMTYIISRLSDYKIDSQLITATTSTIYLYILIFYSFENTKPKTYLIPGSLPQDLFVDQFFVEGIEDKKRIIHFYISEIENYQFKIEKNAELNKLRWNRYENILKAILFLPIVLPICYYFLNRFLL